MERWIVLNPTWSSLGQFSPMEAKWVWVNCMQDASSFSRTRLEISNDGEKWSSAHWINPRCPERCPIMYVRTYVFLSDDCNWTLANHDVGGKICQWSLVSWWIIKAPNGTRGTMNYVCFTDHAQPLEWIFPRTQSADLDLTAKRMNERLHVSKS